MGKKTIKRWKDKAYAYLLEHGPRNAHHLMDEIHMKYGPVSAQQVTQQFMRDSRFRPLAPTVGGFQGGGINHYKVLDWMAVEE